MMIRTLLCFALLVGFSNNSIAQKEYKRIQVGISTSVHLIFPSEVVNYDMGLGVSYNENGEKEVDVLVDQPEMNRLKLAAGLEKFTTTNLFVETENSYYNFILEYKAFPGKLLYQIKRSEANITKEVKSSTVTIARQKIEQKEKHNQLINSIKKRKENKYITAENSPLGIDMVVEHLYTRDSLIFIKLYIYNRSNIKYDVGYIGLVVNERGRGSKQKGVVQDTPIEIPYMYDITNTIDTPVQFTDTYPTVLPQKDCRIVLGLEKLTIDKRKVLSVELWEKDGERKITLRITPKQLVSAKKI